MAVPADRMIFSSAVVTIGSTTAASILPSKYGGRGEFPPPRLLFGTALTFAALSMMGDVTPQIAGPLSVCIAMTALTYYGMPVLENWLAGNNKQPVGSKSPHPGN